MGIDKGWRRHMAGAVGALALLAGTAGGQTAQTTLIHAGTLMRVRFVMRRGVRH